MKISRPKRNHDSSHLVIGHIHRYCEFTDYIEIGADTHVWMAQPGHVQHINIDMAIHMIGSQ